MALIIAKCYRKQITLLMFSCQDTQIILSESGISQKQTLNDLKSKSKITTSKVILYQNRTITKLI